MTVTVRRVPTSEGLPAALRGIFIEAFPANEREPWVDLVTGHADGDRVVYVAEDAGEPVGFAVLESLTPLRAALLDYLAVTPDRRNAGIGSMLLGTLQAFGTGHGWGSGIALEVEPATSPDPVVRSVQERRLAFYRQHGAVDELDLAYAMPDTETDSPLPMHLLVLPVDPAAPVISTRDLVRGIYATAYPFHDDMLAAVLAGQAEPLETRFAEVLADLLDGDERPAAEYRPREVRAARLAARPSGDVGGFYDEVRARAEDVLRFRQEMRDL